MNDPRYMELSYYSYFLKEKAGASQSELSKFLIKRNINLNSKIEGFNQEWELQLKMLEGDK